MTISGKLSLIAALGLNLGAFNASAYDVVGLKDEVQLISAFVKNSKVHTYVEYWDSGISLEDWLEDKINHTYTTSNYTIIELASIIKQGGINELICMVEKDLAWNKFKKRFADLMSVGVASGAACLVIAALADMVNMHIDDRIFDKTFSSKIETLITLDKMQKQIDDLTQKVNKTWIQKLFAKA